MNSRQLTYNSNNTAYNASNVNHARSFAYWADLGITDMTMWEAMPGQNDGGPATYGPLFGSASSEADAKFVTAQAASRGIKMHLGTAMHGNYSPLPAHPLPFNGASPQKDWLFDDTYWNNTIIVGIRTHAKRAFVCNYSGLIFDEEISGNNDGWTYAGHNAVFPGHTQAQCEAAATARGVSWMQAILAEYLNVEYTTYAASTWPTGWSNYKRTANNPTYAPNLQNFFYKGALSVVGYSHVWFLNADFYGGQYFNAAITYGGKSYDRWQWGTVQFDRDQVNKYWDTFLLASTPRAKVDIVPFIAIPQIESGQFPDYQTKSVQTVHEQILPSIQQTINPGERVVPLFGHYFYGAQGDNFDFTPYRTDMRALVQAGQGVITSIPVTITDGFGSVVVNVQRST